MQKRIVRAAVKGLLIFVTALIFLGLILGIWVAATVDTEIDESLFEALSGNSSSKIYYYENESARSSNAPTELVGQELYGGFRSLPVGIEEVPRELIYAFVSIEDKRFFEHKGVDWKRTLGAGANYFLNFREEFGGSTITQQLIKNVTEQDDYSLKRKMQEIIWALDLETKMSKEEILEGYLNVINLSNGCYGVGAACEYYFSCKVEELSLCQCAAIAAITNNPSYYDPIRYPQNNKARRQIILTQMYEQGYIDAQSYNEAYEQELDLEIPKTEKNSVNMWYVDMVINDVIADLMSEKGYSKAMASLMIYTGGLNIYTAMNVKAQKIVEEYYSDSSNFKWQGEEGPQSSMIVIDPYSGDILAVAGAVGEKTANRLQNFATETVRPAGSVIKPLSVYAPALEAGIISWSTVYDDVPVNFGAYDHDPTAEPMPWPKNANGVYRGLTNVNYAIKQSVNTVTVRVLEDLTLESSFDFLKNRLHINSLVDNKVLADGRVITDKDYAALALGQFNYGVSLREITTAYSVFPNMGIYSYSRSYYTVTDRNGNILLENRYRGEAVIGRENAAIMTKMLENVVADGTASGLGLKNRLPCAGKTGTTQSNYDRWFIGYTPQLLGGVWYGYEYPKSLGGSSSGVCIDIWNDVVSRIYESLGIDTSLSFDSTEGLIEVEYCCDSGGLATDACRADPRGNRIEKGYFVKGIEPTWKCNRHVLVAYDTVEGGVADAECDSYATEYVGLIALERVFPMQIYVSDAQYVWRDIGRAIMPETSPSLPFFNNLLREGEYSGISYGDRQYNRYCRAHFDYWKWKERQVG